MNRITQHNSAILLYEGNFEVNNSDGKTFPSKGISCPACG